MRSIIVLFSCIVSVGCVPLIQTIPSYDARLYAVPRLAQTYQKNDTIGHTDVEQRKRDFYQCGMKNYNDGLLDLNSYGDTTEEKIVHAKKVNACMRAKGYVILSGYNDCTTEKGKPSGLCN